WARSDEGADRASVIEEATPAMVQSGVEPGFCHPFGALAMAVLTYAGCSDEGVDADAGHTGDDADTSGSLLDRDDDWLSDADERNIWLVEVGGAVGLLRDAQAHKNAWPAP
ncbi:MAG: hypothetical protein ACI9MR_001527, partial [Myxococcota bacterium]